MTMYRIAHRELLEKGSEIDLLREMIEFIGDRLTALQVEGLCGASHSERTSARTNQRNGLQERTLDTARAPSTCVSRSCATEATFSAAA